MSTKLTVRRSLAAAAAATVLVTSLAAHSDGGGKRYPESQYRHDVMELVKYSAVSILNGVKGNVPVPDAHYAHHADILVQAAKMSTAAFKTDTRGKDGKTDAKPVIWEEWADFESKMNTFIADTEALAAATKGGDRAAVGKAVGKVFSGCKDCHDKYRAD